ncbi:MAG: Do family serine endopeptidase [Candidatus Binatia bacterium]
MTQEEPKNNVGQLGSVFLFCLLALLIGFVAGTYLPAQNKSTPPGVERPVAWPPEFVAVAEKLAPSVVNISTALQATSSPQSSFDRPSVEEDSQGSLLDESLPRPGFQQRGLGSGFIIDREGHILTNNHVVENTRRITVKLSDRREFQANVVGRDPKTDVALIKINAGTDLAPIPLGESAQLAVGEWVIAIGSPFGLQNSVTAGIVSAKGRRLGAGPYDDFIQTDASINPGNSGGPLVDLQGRVIGVNTAIATETGANIGIGFAIPIDLVKRIVPELKKRGQVTRGWLGIAVQPVTPKIAASLGLQKSGGAWVAEVTGGGPADLAGLEKGDVIIEYDGQTIAGASELAILVARTKIGRDVELKVVRKGKQIPIPATVGESQETKVVAPRVEKAQLGLLVQSLPSQTVSSLGLKQPEGVMVKSVEPGSNADDAGLRRGDIILQIDQTPVADTDDFQKKITETETAKNTLFLVRRGENNLFVALTVPK